MCRDEEIKKWDYRNGVNAWTGERTSRSRERCGEDTRQKGALRDGEGRRRVGKREGRSESAGVQTREKSRKNCGKETAADRFVKPPRRKKTRRVCPDTHTALGVLPLDISTAVATAAAAAAARAKVRVSYTRVYTYTCRVHMRRDAATTVRIRALVFSLIANRPVFSIFKDTLVPRICYLSTTSLVPACPLFLPACMPSCPCLHLEEVEQPASTNTLIFSSLSVHTACRCIRYIRYCKLSFLTKRYRHLEIFTANWNAQVPVRSDRRCNFTFFQAENKLGRVYIFFSYIMLSYFYAIFILACGQRNRIYDAF